MFSNMQNSLQNKINAFGNFISNPIVTTNNAIELRELKELKKKIKNMIKQMKNSQGIIMYTIFHEICLKIQCLHKICNLYPNDARLKIPINVNTFFSNVSDQLGLHILDEICNYTVITHCESESPNYEQFFDTAFKNRFNLDSHSDLDSDSDSDSEYDSEYDSSFKSQQIEHDNICIDENDYKSDDISFSQDKIYEEFNELLSQIETKINSISSSGMIYDIIQLSINESNKLEKLKNQLKNTKDKLKILRNKQFK